MSRTTYANTENEKCVVRWCTSVATAGRMVCDLHVKRPVIHSHESHEAYLFRLREEDARSRKTKKP
jgi:hypothetical protein